MSCTGAKLIYHSSLRHATEAQHRISPCICRVVDLTRLPRKTRAPHLTAVEKTIQYETSELVEFELARPRVTCPERDKKSICYDQPNRQNAVGLKRFFHAAWRNPGESTYIPKPPESGWVFIFWPPEISSRFVLGVFAGFRFVDSTPGV